MVRHIALACALMSSTALVALAPPQASAATWGPDVRLVFSNAGDIWIAHPDGSHLANLTNSPASEMAPTLSHTGRYVAYQAISGVQSTVNVYDTQTGTHTALIAGAQPDFSPAADVIAFNRYESGTFGIYSVNLDGTDLKTWVSGPDASVDSTMGSGRPVPALRRDRGDAVVQRRHGWLLRRLLRQSVAPGDCWRRPDGCGGR